MNFDDYQKCTGKAAKYDHLRSAAKKCQRMIDKLQKKGRLYKKTKFYTIVIMDKEAEYEGHDILFDQAELLSLQEILKLKQETLKAEMEAL